MAATTRATVKQIDLSVLKGKKVNLFVNAIGDSGAGNLFGGRLSVVSQLRGDYIQSPPVKETSSYPRYTSTSSSTDSSGGAASSSATSLLASPAIKTTEQEGSGSELQLGVEYQGLGSYRTSEEFTSDDLQYLFGLLHTYLFLQGVHIVPPSEAEIDVYVTVDVFGTVRTRVDWFLANNEILRAKTALEIIAVDHLTGKLLMPPQSSATEAEYNEQYVLWAGPVVVKKFVRPSEPLLCDFSDIEPSGSPSVVAEQDGDIPYPFRQQMKKWLGRRDE